MCVSCPHACMTPTVLPFVLATSPCWRTARPTSSRTGRPSMSARSATTGPGRPPLSSATTPVLRDAGLRLESEALEPLDDVLRGLDLAVRELGMLVQMAAPREQLRLDAGGQLVDLGGERRCAGGACRSLLSDGPARSRRAQSGDAARPNRRLQCRRGSDHTECRIYPMLPGLGADRAGDCAGRLAPCGATSRTPNRSPSRRSVWSSARARRASTRRSSAAGIR